MQRTRLADGTSEVEDMSTYLGDETGTARAHALQPPPKDAPADERKIWLDHQLDKMVGKTLLRQFVLLGPHQRRYGGACFCPVLLPFSFTNRERYKGATASEVRTG